MEISQIGIRPVDKVNFAAGLPIERLQPYLEHSGGNVTQAINCYLWNIEISSAFWGSFHLLEVSLRNALDKQLTRNLGVSGWWNSQDKLHKVEYKRIQDVALVVERGSAPFTSGSITAGASFGFWVSLLDRKYHQRLWVNNLEHAFPNYEGKRSELHRNLYRLRKLRNRIAHHEPIHNRDLAHDQQIICDILGYVNPIDERVLRKYSRVPSILQHKQASILGKNPIAF